MELEIQQCEKTKAVREEQLERLTQICQEQAVSPRAPTGFSIPASSGHVWDWCIDYVVNIMELTIFFL